MAQIDEDIAMKQATVNALEILRAAAERAGDVSGATALAESKSDAENELATLIALKG